MASLLVVLVCLALGTLMLVLEPHRTLSCTHPERPGAAACQLSEATEDGAELPSECVLLPDIQCRLETRVLGLVPLHDQTWTHVLDFDAHQQRGTGRRDRRAPSFLRLITSLGPVDLGRDGQPFAKTAHLDHLKRFARDAGAVSLTRTHSRPATSVIGGILLAMGVLIAASNLFGVRR